MPYAVQPPVVPGLRERLAEARWDSMVAARPDLLPAVRLQRQLLGAVLRLTRSFEEAPAPRLSLPPRYVTAKLVAGIPALVGEPIPLPVDRLTPTLAELCRHLSEGGGGEASLAIRRAVEEGGLDVPALLTLTLRREQALIRTAATRAGVGHDLLWLVADLAVGPFAHLLRRTLFDGSTPPLRSALDAWSRGFCPLCGSWPAFAELLPGRRVLRCAFCGCGWEGAPGECVYCARQAEGHAVGAAAAGQPDPGPSDAAQPYAAPPERAIEACSGCRGYLKRLPADELLPFPLLPIADLDSMDLDLAAMNRGFARPALKSFSARR